MLKYFSTSTIFVLLLGKLFCQNPDPSIPLIQSNWHQKAPYNDECPTWTYQNNTIRSLVGCGGNALGQILRYYSYPVNPSNSLSYYVYMGRTGQSPWRQQINVNFNQITYDFANIPINPVSQTSIPRAQFLFHAAASIETDFKLYLSYSNLKDIENALKKYFNYDKSTLKRVNRENLTKIEFLNKIKLEIDSERPVILYAADLERDISHYMIVDGYELNNGLIDRIHINMGYKGLQYNKFYDIDNINPRGNIYDDNQEILIGIRPYENYDIPSNIITREENQGIRSNLSINCPSLIYPNVNQRNASNKTELEWEDQEDAQEYFVTIKALGQNIVYYDSVPSYAGINYFKGPELLPPNDSIEVKITPIDINGNALTCPTQKYYTDTTACNLVLGDITTSCINPSSYNVNVTFSGIAGHTYDLWLEDETGVITSIGSVTPGTHILGPVAINKNVVVVIEDEAQPYDCYDSESVRKPNCVICPNITLSVDSTVCKPSGYDVYVKLLTTPSATIDLYTGRQGINTHNNVTSGQYIFYNIPFGINTVAIAEDTLHPYDCYTLLDIISPNCLLPCTQLTSPINGATGVSTSTNISWSPSSGATGYKLTIGTTPGGTQILNNANVGNVTSYNPTADFPYNAAIYVKITPYNTNGDATGCMEENFTTHINNIFCVVTNINDSGVGSLREAINCANSNIGPDTIRFDIPGGGPFVIQVGSLQLPALNDDGTVIDGTSQPNFIPGLITLQSTIQNLGNGLEIYADSCSIFGLTLSRFGSGIYMVQYSGDVRTVFVGAPNKGNIFFSNATGISLHGSLPKAIIRSNEFYGDFSLNFVGVSIQSVNNNLIGGDDLSEGNKFHHLWRGVRYANTSNQNISLKKNTFWCNTTPIYSVGTPTSSPDISFANSSTISGSASANAYIEVFYKDQSCSSDPCQGRYFLGSTVADNLGNWSIQGSFTTGDHVTATAKMDLKQTSFFSTCVNIGIPICTNLTTPSNAASNIPINTNIIWAASAGASGYKLTLGITPGGTQILNNSNVGNVTTYNPPADFLYEATIYVKIIPYNANGDAVGCASETFTTQINPFLCVVTNTNDSGSGSLREAINCANNTAGPDTIRFNIPGGGPFLIQVGSQLPAFNDVGTCIDGTTQPNYVPGIIELKAPSQNFGNGLTINADACSVFGLTISMFGSGIRMTQNSGAVRTVIVGAPNRGNIFLKNGEGIGLYGAYARAIVKSNEFYGDFSFNFAGVHAQSDNNVIGGDDVSEGNLFHHLWRGVAYVSTVNTNISIKKNAFWCNATPIYIFTSSTSSSTPVISLVNSNLISGTAGANAYIEVFYRDQSCSSNPCQGRYFIGSTYADNAGIWSIEGSFTSGGHVTATAKKDLKHTSGFSSCVIIPGPPACTQLTTPSNASSNISVNTNITWSALAGASGYKLTLGTTSGGTQILNNADVGNVTSYDPMIDFPYNITIYVKIIPYNANGDAVGCVEESFMTDNSGLTCPSPIYVSSGQNCAFSLDGIVFGGQFVYIRDSFGLFMGPSGVFQAAPYNVASGVSGASAHINKSYQYEAHMNARSTEHPYAPTGIYCTGNLTLEDNFAPSGIWQSSVSIPCDSLNAFLEIDMTNVLRRPLISDNCCILDSSVVISNLSSGCSGSIIRTFTYTDCGGNIFECVDTICISKIYFRDADGDDFGDINNTLTACSQPIGYILDNSDCDDSDLDVYPGSPIVKTNQNGAQWDDVNYWLCDNPTMMADSIVINHNAEFNQGSQTLQASMSVNQGTLMINSNNILTLGSPTNPVLVIVYQEGTLIVDTGATLRIYGTLIEANGLIINNGHIDVLSAHEDNEVPFICGSSTVTFMYNGSPVTYGTVVSAGGKCWLDRNLGASQVAASSTDSAAYGDLFQWGRGVDGHQTRNPLSGTTTTLSNTDSPGHGNFIINSSPGDWRSPQNGNLWQGVNGINNPCPEGFRIPIIDELIVEQQSWCNNNSVGAFASPLKLSVGGSRTNYDGLLMNVGSFGSYWSSTKGGNNSIYLTTAIGNAFAIPSNRAWGYSVRCIKDEGSSPIVGSIGSINCPGATITGQLTSGTVASGASVSVPYTCGNGGTHSGQTVTSTGVTGLTATLAAGMFALHSGTLNYTITGTPDFEGTAVFSLNIGGQMCSLSVIIGSSTFTCGTSTVTFNYNGSPVTYGTVLSVGRCWLDRNLGASQVATSSMDVAAYGDLFQWGRDADGHQIRSPLSSTNPSLSNTDSPGNGDFIIMNSTPNDWRSPQNNNLWQDVNGVNNPCPSGYCLPTETEIDTERTSWNSNNTEGAFASQLKLSVAGQRLNSSGSLSSAGTFGRYWSSTVSGTSSRSLSFSNSSANMSNSNRALGSSVRCIKVAIPAGSIGSLTCFDATITGSLTFGVVASGVSAAVPYTGGNGGTHSGQTVASAGVTGLTATMGAGSFVPGSGSLTYNITGTPASEGIANFALNIGGQICTLNVVVAASEPSYPFGYVHCNPSNPTAIVEVLNPATNKIWMDRNLGANRAATSSADAEAYGSLFQWGRRADGHQCVNRYAGDGVTTSGNTTTLSSTDTPTHGLYIRINSGNNDWRSPQNNNLWQGLNGLNNPCPSGYRLPTETELDSERSSWSSNNSDGAFASSLKLSSAGYRNRITGSLVNVGTNGYYWSSTINSTNSRSLTFDGSNASILSLNRAFGESVRCIKE